VSAASASFAAHEAILAGEWDGYLDRIAMAIRRRRRMFDMTSPPPEPLPAGQVWVAMNGPGPPHWEPRGTGVVIVLDDSSLTDG